MQKTSYAFIHRIHVRVGLVAALVGCFSLSAHSAYVTLPTPSGVSGVAGSLTATASAADSVFGQLLHKPSSINATLAGQSVKMSTTLKLAAAAPRVAAAAIFAHPYVRIGVGVASWLGVAKLVYDATAGVWREVADESQSGSYEYFYNTQSGGAWTRSANAACGGEAAYMTAQGGGGPYSYGSAGLLGSAPNYRCKIRVSYEGRDPEYTELPLASREATSTDCPTGWTKGADGCYSPALTQPEFVDKLAPPNSTSMPSSVPKEVPFPLPVESVPWINSEPGSNPSNRPVFIPTGDPVRNPNYDPNAAPSATNQPFLQPGVRVVPSPTAAEPWRVDLQPVNRPTDSPQPTDPVSEDDPNGSDGDKPDEKSDFCLENPDVLACAKPDLDTPDGEIPRSTRDVTLNEENLFGGGSCPADVYFAPHGLQSLKIWDWNKACGYISSYLKPIVILCCTFAAFMILVPGRTE